MNNVKQRKAFALTVLSKRCAACNGRMILTADGIIHEKNEKSNCP